MKKVNYRKIWRDYYGDIPKDENGITYDIHHIDGNRSNNCISNLKAVSIREHYEIHLSKGDIAAAHQISQRLNLSPKERDYINRKISEYNTGRKREDVSIRNSLSIGEKNHMFGKSNEFRSKLNKTQILGNNPRAKAVLQYDLSGKLVAEYDCIKSATKNTNIAKIGEKCRGIRKQTGQYIFKFKN